jgi:hypothetical protein
MKVQINSGLSLWLDEKWGSGHKAVAFPTDAKLMHRARERRADLGLDLGQDGRQRVAVIRIARQ